jgi:hypothetical protein
MAVRLAMGERSGAPFEHTILTRACSETGLGIT